MAHYDVPTLQAGCPWAGWAPPNIKWCEENLCAWITAPANTWSNLAYILVAVFMWRHARRHGRIDVRIFVPASIAVGLTSGLYHASYTWFFQFFDFVGMYLFLDLAIAFNLERLGIVKGFAGRTVVYLGLVIISSALTPLFFELGVPIQLLVALTILFSLALEVACFRSESVRPDRTFLYAALALAGAGATCSFLDLKGIWCDPHNHWLQGHACWHVFTALALYGLYRFYGDIEAAKSAPIPTAQP